MAGPTIIKGFPGQAVDAHLKRHGHLPDHGCCEYDQVINEGDIVSFAHEDVHRKVLRRTDDYKLEIEGMAGLFDWSIFRKINYKDHE